MKKFQKKSKEKANEEYEQYIMEQIENKSQKGIIFCAQKHREGSDIPLLIHVYFE